MLEYLRYYISQLIEYKTVKIKYCSTKKKLTCNFTEQLSVPYTCQTHLMSRPFCMLCIVIIWRSLFFLSAPLIPIHITIQCHNLHSSLCDSSSQAGLRIEYVMFYDLQSLLTYTISFEPHYLYPFNHSFIELLWSTHLIIGIDTERQVFKHTTRNSNSHS